MIFSEYDTGILIYKNNAKTFSLKLQNHDGDITKKNSIFIPDYYYFDT